MAIWTVETDTDFTSFYFPLEDEKIFFIDLVKNYFEESKPVKENWHHIHMLRDEPMKHPDFFEIDGTDVIAISQKAVDSIHSFLNDTLELLPIETDAGRYYALNVLDIVDCLNKEDSEFVVTKNGVIVNYSLLEFDEEKLGDSAFFKIPELPYCIFISDDIEGLCEENYLQGLVFDTESNLVWYPE